MATITYLDRRGAPPAGLKQRVGPVFERLTAAWNRRKTERMLESLPQEIRKDIGWPTTVGK